MLARKPARIVKAQVREFFWVRTGLDIGNSLAWWHIESTPSERRIKVDFDELTDMAKNMTEDQVNEMDAEISVNLAMADIHTKIDFLQSAVVRALACGEGLDLETANPPMTITNYTSLMLASATISEFLKMVNDPDFVTDLVFSLLMTLLEKENKIIDGITGTNDV